MRVCLSVLTGRALVAAVLLSLLAGAAPAQDFSLPGPFQPVRRSVVVSRPNASTFTAQVFYPATAAGLNTPFDPAAGVCPGVSFGHGFLSSVDWYRSTLEHLATWGFVAIASESEGTLFPSHSNFALDLRHCLTYLEQQNVLSGSFLEGRINVQRFGLSGHSMGGGCSILAAAADPRVKALAPLAPANTNPSAIAQMPIVTAPTTLICGTSDTIVPTGSHGLPMYNAGFSPKQIQNIQGGWHCGFIDVSAPIGCDSGPMPRADQLAITRRLLTAFFMLHLKGDQGVWSQVWGPARDADPRIVTSADPGASWSPTNLVISGFGGKQAAGQATLTNTGDPDSFAVLISGNAWTVTPGQAQVGPLATGASAIVPLAVQIPPGFQPAVSELILSSRSVVDGATRAWVRVTARRLCQGDFDRSDQLNINDFIAYQNAYAAGLPDADIDNSGSLNINDFIAFQNAYAAGCS